MFANPLIRRLQRLGLAAVAAIGVSAAVLPPAPASAHLVVTVGGPVYRPYWQPYYPAYYYRPYYKSYYYKPRVVYRGCGYGWHWRPGHWNRWGHWVPAGCRPNW